MVHKYFYTCIKKKPENQIGSVSIELKLLQLKIQSTTGKFINYQDGVSSSLINYWH